ncbi:MAG: hypothetical protein A3K22_04540 [Deltaproteobacteria bacterium RBG_16_42_7]|nr:MAG: hypothetical protein A3K22_04540 [Deltaproteobacteria bacterium RBG_16_42_7]
MCQTMINIGYLSTFYHTSILLIAGGRNAEETLGTKIEWKLFGNGPDIIDAFKKGEIDMAYIGLPPAIIGLDKGTAITCVAGGHMEGTVLCGERRYKGFPAIQDLGGILKQFIGHKIGVPGKGSIHDVILKEHLNRFKLEKDVGVINFQWADEIIEAMHKEKVSAALGTPALAVALSVYMDAKILYPPSKLWPNNPSYGILVHNDFLNKEKKIIANFLIIHEEMSAFLRNKPVEAAEIISDYIKLVDKEFVLKTLKISPKYCAQITDEYISSTMEFVKALKRLGYISRDVAKEEIFDTSLIIKIHPLKDHYGDGISTSE